MVRIKQTAFKSVGKAPQKQLSAKIKAHVSGKQRPADEGGVKKKPHRWRPGTVAIRSIKKYQKTTDMLIRKLPFRRVVRDVVSKLTVHKGEPMKCQVGALEAIQEASEAYLVALLQDTNEAALHAERITVFGKDISFARRLRGEPRLDLSVGTGGSSEEV